MENSKIVRGLAKLQDMFEVTFGKVSQSLDFENPLPDRNINQILENPVDKQKLDEAVELLKQNKTMKSTEIILSDKETLIISIS